MGSQANTMICLLLGDGPSIIEENGASLESFLQKQTLMSS